MSTDREAAENADERIRTDLAVPAPARPVVAPYGATTIDGSQGTTTGRAVRTAADRENEQICTALVVPRRGHVPALQKNNVRISAHLSHSLLVLSP